MGNGRHRVVPSIFNGGSEYSHDYLKLKDNLIDVLNDSNGVRKHPKVNPVVAGQRLVEAAQSLGNEAQMLAKILTEEIAPHYLEGTHVTNENVLRIERQITELSVALALKCGMDGQMTEFLWKVVEYMWLETGMMYSCLTGSAKIMKNRRQSDDRGGLNYAWN